MLLLTVLALAASASTLLVIPEVFKEKEEQISRTLPIDNERNDKEGPRQPTLAHTSVCLPCTECSGRDTKIWIDSNIKDDEVLALNGRIVYPRKSLAKSNRLAAVLTSDGAQPNKPRMEDLTYNLTITADRPSIGATIVTVNIIKVGKLSVEKVPKMKFRLIETSSESDIQNLKGGGGTKEQSTSNENEKASTKSCESFKCGFAQFVDGFWIRTVLLVTNSPLLKTSAGLANAGLHYDDDSNWMLLKAIILLVEYFILLCTFLATLFFIPVFAVIYIALYIGDLLKDIRRRYYGNTEAKEDENCGLLTDDVEEANRDHGASHKNLLPGDVKVKEEEIEKI